MGRWVGGSVGRLIYQSGRESISQSCVQANLMFDGILHKQLMKPKLGQVRCVVSTVS